MRTDYDTSQLLRLLASFSILNRYRIVFALAVFAAVVLVTVSEMGYRNAQQASDSLNVVNEKRGALNHLLQLAIDAETGQRGYLITGDTAYLGPYDEAIANVGSTLDILRKHYLDSPTDLQLFAEMSRSLSKKLAEMEVTVAMRKKSTQDIEWRKIVDTSIGRQYMDSVRELKTKLFERSEVERQRLDNDIDRSLLVARIGVGLGAAAALIAFFLYLRQAERSDQQSMQQARALATEKERLDKLVEQRTVDLATLATRLQSVQEAEREHLARELHDEMGALMTAAKLDVARLKALIQPLTPAVEERIAHLVNSLNAGIVLKRRIIEDLRPSALANLGLIPALENLLRDFGERSQISIASDLSPVVVSAPTALTIYRTVQESLTNIYRHAKASEINVSLATVANAIVLRVKDNGVGFDVDDRFNASHGLAGIRHRVQAARGRLRINASPGHGCELTATLPVVDLPPNERSL
jgi:signal transduction histidine kinase